MQKTVCAFLTMLSTTAFAYGDWIDMRKTDSERIDFTFSKCYYEQSFSGNFSVSIVIKGSQYSCPYSIKEALNNSSFPRTRESMLLIFRDTRFRGYDIFRVIQSFLKYNPVTNEWK